jgi:hypothetical protein
MSAYGAAEQFAAMSDEQLSKCVAGDARVGNELEAERAKRRRIIEAKEQELARLHQEQLERIRQRKDALQYSDELAQEICERIAIGELCINICLDEHTPTMRKCNQWLRDNPEFNQLYQSAINDRLSVFEEEVLKIADDMKHDYKTVIKNGKEKRVPDPEQIARARLRIEVRFKWLKALRPQRWAEVSTLNVKNQDEFDPATFSSDELESQIAAIEYKSRVRAA